MNENDHDGWGKETKETTSAPPVGGLASSRTLLATLLLLLLLLLLVVVVPTMKSRSLLGVVISLPLLLAPAARGGTSDHRYKPGEHVELWVNKVREQHSTVVSQGLTKPEATICNHGGRAGNGGGAQEISTNAPRMQDGILTVLFSQPWTTVMSSHSYSPCFC